MEEEKVDEYNYGTITDEYYTPLPYEDINYEDIDLEKLPEGGVEAEVPTSTIITYNETDVSSFDGPLIETGERGRIRALIRGLDSTASQTPFPTP